jgi:hypothetical protein
VGCDAAWSRVCCIEHDKVSCHIKQLCSVPLIAVGSCHIHAPHRLQKLLQGCNMLLLPPPSLL